MRRIVVKEACPQMIAARPVRDPRNAAEMLVNPGESLCVESIVRLHRAGVYDLWVRDPGLEFLDDQCTNQPTNAQARLAEALRASLLRLSSWLPQRTLMKHTGLLLEELVPSLISAACRCCRHSRKTRCCWRTVRT